MSTKRPNILLIMTDQMRWDAMSCSGDWVQTPNMDRIANEGVRFSNCVTTTPVCIPARLSLATGTYPHNTGVWDNMGHDMPAETPTWMQAVRDAGYRTSLFGKTHLHSHHGDLRDREHLVHAYGLDDVDEIGGPRASTWVGSHMTEMWEKKGVLDDYKKDYADRFANTPWVARPSALPLEDYADVYVGRQAKQYLDNYRRDEPWFCWVSFGGPHEPWDAPEPYASMYDPDRMPEAVPLPDAPTPELPSVLREKVEQDASPTEREIAEMRANYAGNVTLIDDQIGAILDAIEARGELENTAIVFCSDHGELNGDWGLVYKNTFLNGAVRVPLLVRTPETAASKLQGRVCTSMVEWIDIGPTLAELAGGELKHRQFGMSLVPVTHDPHREHRPDALSEYRGELMILNERWKLAINQHGEVYLLFDVVNDPNEQNNLAGTAKYHAVEQELQARLLERLVSTLPDKSPRAV